MEALEYKIMYELETDYWWYRNLHEILSDTIRAEIRSGDKLLDAGCGTGGFMLRLRNLSPQVYGFDISGDAAGYWQQRELGARVQQASINEIPYADDTFAATLSADILECEGVEDRRAYTELVRVTRSGGLVVVVVPAYQWMMTEGHHKAVHAVRRYNRQSLRALAADSPVQIERLTHAYAALFPLIGGVRFINRLEEQFHQVEVKSELQTLPPWVNTLLYRITNMERHLLRRMNMPFGSSLVMVARKQ